MKAYVSDTDDLKQDPSYQDTWDDMIINVSVIDLPKSCKRYHFKEAQVMKSNFLVYAWAILIHVAVGSINLSAFEISRQSGEKLNISLKYVFYKKWKMIDNR